MKLLLPFCFFLIAAVAVQAQESTASQYSVSGFVKDEKGKAVALATVSVYKKIDFGPGDCNSNR